MQPDTPEGERKVIKQNIRDRGKWETVGYYLYKVFRVIYVVVWFYFLPMIIFYA